MWDDLRYLLRSFPRADRLRLVGYVVAQFFLSLADLVGLAVVLPLMQVLTGTSLDDGYIGVLYRLVGEPGRQPFVLIMAGFMVLAFAVKAGLGLALQWWSSGLVIRLQIATSTRLLDAALSHDYLTHRRRDTAEVIRSVDAAVADAHSKVLGGLLGIISAGLSILLILVLLLVVTPTVTIAALIYFGIVVFLIQKLLADRNQKAGHAAVMSAWSRSLALFNALLGFREIKMHEVRPEFVERFRAASIENGAAGQRANFYGTVPKYVLELMSITGIALILALTLLVQDPQTLMPTLTLFVAATVKLLPTMSGLTATLGSIRAGQAGLRIAVDALRTEGATAPVAPPPTPAAAAGTSAPTVAADLTGEPPLPLEVAGVSFRYPDGERDVLDDVSLTIPPGSSLALCGSSGSGKTTLVDIMLGLFSPARGVVTYGGRPTADLGPAWHRIVAYVPQDVFLLNDTVAANVAFGEPESSWDRDKITDAIRRARMAEAVADMPDGLDTMLGERGSRISGGQRQRIGIARALYRDPRVVVFDEATSALDNETEDQISKTIHEMSGAITTVIVAHRLSTVRHVDQLAYLEGGRIVALGTFEEVRATSPSFARMVELGRLD